MSFKCLHSDSEELDSTLHDNTVQISIPVKYEVGLTFSVWVPGSGSWFIDTALLDGRSVIASLSKKWPTSLNIHVNRLKGWYDCLSFSESRPEHIVVEEGEQYSSVINDTRLIGEEVNINYTVKITSDCLLIKAENVLLQTKDLFW